MTRAELGVRARALPFALTLLVVVAGCAEGSSPEPSDAVCGDRVLSPGEQCDDGNTADGDGCSSRCTLLCGNGRIEAGEACDDGNHKNGDGCDSDARGLAPSQYRFLCTSTACGNGLVSTGEACDDGNTDPNDACDDHCLPTSCGLSTGCGNCLVETASGEECDDGNVTPGAGNDRDLCDPNCRHNACGNGYKGFDQNGRAEECDDGNTISGDGCSALCEWEGEPPTAGDGGLDALASVTSATFEWHAYRGLECTGGCARDLGFYIDADGDEACTEGSTELAYSTTLSGVPGEACAALASSGEITDPAELAAMTALVQAAARRSDPSGASARVRLLVDIDAPGEVFVGYATARLGLSNGKTITAKVGNASTAPGSDGRCRNVVNVADEDACGGDPDLSGLSNLFDARAPITITPPPPPEGDAGVGGVDEDCGNGALDPGEACDYASHAGPTHCTFACTIAACGDGVLTAALGEECDDGNLADGDGCSAACAVELGWNCHLYANACDGTGTGSGGPATGPFVNDPGIVGNDPSSAIAPGKHCLPVCGDGCAIDSIEDRFDEQCDDGNADNTDGCDTFCRSTTCGDGVLTVADAGTITGIGGAEECDDGNRFDLDGCSSTCRRETCGDGVLNGASLVTRDPVHDPLVDCAIADNAGRACAAASRATARCVYDPGQGTGWCAASEVEACDDHNTVDGDGCDSNCRPTGCGNGVVTAGEACDDGDLDDSDGCDTHCRPNGCGDGVVTASELCYGLPDEVASGEGVIAVDAGDFNGDRVVDLVVASGHDLTVALMRPGARRPLATDWLVNDQADVVDVAVGDFDGDGFQDVAALDAANDTVQVRFGDGTGKLCPCSAVGLAMAPGSRTLTAGDLDGNGQDDLLVESPASALFSVWLNPGDLTRSSATPVASYALAGASTGVVVGELDGDPAVEVAVLVASPPSVAVFEVGANGTLVPAGGPAFAGQPRALAAGDIDGDGRLDVVIAGDSPPSVTAWRMIGGRSTTFEAIATAATAEVLAPIVIGDVDADHDLDVVGLAGGAEAILVVGDGHGGLTPVADPILLGTGATDLVLGDFDGDRDPDFAVAHGTGASVVRNNP
jgi:cysteine-rich repeat protein